AAGVSRHRRAEAGGRLRREVLRLHRALRRREPRRRPDPRAARRRGARRRHRGNAQRAHPRTGARCVRRGAAVVVDAIVEDGWAARDLRVAGYRLTVTAGNWKPATGNRIRTARTSATTPASPP